MNGKLRFPRMSSGISMHVKEHMLDSVIGYIKVEESSCFKDGYYPCGL